MMKHRINTDLFLRVAVTRIGGEPEDFSTANDITVTVWHMYHNWRRQEDYQISGNEVTLQLSAGDQSHIGPYGVTIRYTKPDSGSETGIRHYAVDIPKAFELSPIACCEASDTVTLCAHVMVCRDGIDGRTPYIGENGNWWVGGEDTGKPSKGKDGEPGTFAYPVFTVDPKTGVLTVREPFFMDDDDIKLEDGYLVMKI